MARGKDIKVGAARIDFVGNSLQLEQAAKKARSAMYKFNRQMRPIINNMKRFAIAGAAIGTSIVYAGNRVSANIDRLAKFARSVRGTTADMQVLARVADLNGVEMQKLEMALKKFNVTLETIGDGTAYKMVTDQFDKLNISAKELLEMPLAERVQTVIERIQQYGSVTEQAAISAQLFGTRNGSMIVQFAKADFQRATKELEDYGGALNQVQAREVQQMRDQIGEMQHAFSNFAIQLVASYSPAIRRWARDVSNSLKPGGRLRGLIESLTTAFSTSVRVIDQFIFNLRKLFGSTTIMVGAFALLTTAVLRTISTLITAMEGLYKIGIAFLATEGAITKSRMAMEFFKGGLKSLVAVAGVVGIAIAGIMTAVNLWRGATDESNFVTSRATLLTDKLAHAYDNLASSIKGATDRSAENLRQMRKNLTGQVTGMTVLAVEMLAEVERDPEYKAAVKKRDDALAILGRPVSSMNPRAQGKWRDRQKEATRELLEAGRIIEDKKQDYNNLVAKAKEANDILIQLGIELTSHQLGSSSFNVGNIQRVLENYVKEHQRKLMEFGREIEEKQIGITTQSYDRLRDARIWFEDMTQKIKDAGVGFEHLHAKARAAFDAMSRHAQGIIYPMEQLVLIADGFSDRFQTVTDAIVDRWIDGTTSIADAWKKMAREIVKDMVWMQAKAALSRIGSHLLSSLGGLNSGMFGPFRIGPIPGASPQGALSGTINANNYAGAFARGGNIPAGKYGLVGEYGAEFVRGPASVTSAAKTAAMMGRGAGRAGIDINMYGSDWQAIRADIINQIDAAKPDIMNGTSGMIMKDMQRSSNTQRSMRRGLA